MLELNTSGLKCPLPVLKAKKALRGMETGEQLRVVSTDPSSVQDFADYCGNAGHTLLASDVEDASFTYVIEKG
ncbi:MAG: hypothetical protein CBD27_01255 [Rhodospirillaceae bacterium TMED167]|nr:sulfurtransferase tusA [Rhodospirillaceae bacterium]MDG2033751.1 sulfurtransferase TusA family protein [Rhodospirillales bacterium]OUW30489.1 MAG: hypothetical protein CBD27_01255 [Rhodospirillaceae bacterium TMED167]